MKKFPVSNFQFPFLPVILSRRANGSEHDASSRRTSYPKAVQKGRGIATLHSVSLAMTLFFSKWKVNGKWQMANGKCKGFTLVEIMVVVALIGIMVAIGSNIFVGVIRSNTKAAILAQLREDGNRSLELMSRAVQSATEVADPDSTAANDANCSNRKYIIVKNRSQTAQGTAQQLYTRFSFVQQPVSTANDFISIISSNDLTYLKNLTTSANLNDFKNGAITNFGGKTSVNVLPTMCFRVQRASGVTVVGLKFTLQQGKEVTSLRKEFEGTVDFDTTYTLRVY